MAKYLDGTGLGKLWTTATGAFIQKNGGGQLSNGSTIGGANLNICGNGQSMYLGNINNDEYINIIEDTKVGRKLFFYDKAFDSNMTSDSYASVYYSDNDELLVVSQAQGIYANSFIKAGGAGQFLLANGTLDSNTYSAVDPVSTYGYLMSLKAYQGYSAKTYNNDPAFGATGLCVQNVPYGTSRNSITTTSASSGTTLKTVSYNPSSVKVTVGDAIVYENGSSSYTYITSSIYRSSSDRWSLELRGLNSVSQSVSIPSGATLYVYRQFVSGNYSYISNSTDTRLMSQYSALIGMGNGAVSRSYSLVAGYNNKALGYYNSSEPVFMLGQYLRAFYLSGDATQSNNGDEYYIGQYGPPNQLIIGKYNGSVYGAFIIGQGTSESARKNVFRVSTAGATYGAGAFNTSGADYAEYFEWEDGNPLNEDRAGLFVALVEDKIKVADRSDDIIGVVSCRPVVVGNADGCGEEWHKRFLTDIYGRPIMEDFEEEFLTGEFDEEGHPIMATRTSQRQKLNPEYRESEKYVPREERPEWCTVGLLGQLVVRDDGTCIPGRRCSVAEGGIATLGSDYRVMKRLDENHIRILASFL